MASRCLAFCLALLLLLGACLRYQPQPLTPVRINATLGRPDMRELSVKAKELRHPILPPVNVDLRDGISPDEAAVLAVLLNPSLRAERDKRQIAQAQLLEAGLLPNPELGMSLHVPTGGPTQGTGTAYGIDLSWSVRDLLTHSARQKAAAAEFRQVNLDVAWREWQVAVGLLADDAILVLESIYHCWEQGDEHWPGIWRGVKLIAVPDITGTLTVVSVFIPLLFVGGLAGLFFIPFALAMTLALLASLVVSLTVIPLGLGFIQARPHTRPTLGGWMLEHLRRLNERLFGMVARRPRLSLLITFLVLLLSLAGLALVPVNFLPLPNEGALLESSSLPPGTSLNDAEAALAAMTERLRADPAVDHVFVRIGSASTTAYTEPSYAGEIQIALKPGINVSSLDRIGERIKQESQRTGVQVAVGTPTLERVGESLSGLPQPFAIQLFGGNVTQLRALSEQIADCLRASPGLTSIFNNDAYPVSQLQITPKTAALAAHDLTAVQLHAQLHPLLAGEVVAEVPEGNVPLKLYVRLAGAPDRTLRELGQLPIRTQGWTPLEQLAEIKMVTTPNQLRHVAGARALEVLATPTGLGGFRFAREAISQLRLPTGYRAALAGLYPELERAALGLGAAALAAFVLMLGILILQFDGLLVPGLLLLEVPLALMGGAIALIVSRVGLNATGLVAFLTLIGIGLSHGIVLLDRARRNEAGGMAVEEAMREAIHVRFRPIVLTTLTAALGMLPTALGWGQGAAPEQGLAVVILGGVLWSAIRSTNLIPALYIYWHRKQIARETRMKRS